MITKRLWLCMLAVTPCAAPALAATTMRVDVDARDGARRLIHTQTTVETPESLRQESVGLLYVEWTPGNHNPSGPIQNVVDFVVHDGAGRRLSWRRDEIDPNLHRVSPAGAEVIKASFSYIANQPGVNSRSSDTYGHAEFGGLNWNTVLVYPSWTTKSETMVQASLTIPAGWRWACGLKVAGEERLEDGSVVVKFAEAPLWEVVDSPVIYGRHLRTYDLGEAGGARHYLHAAAATEARTELAGERVDALRQMILETVRVFGPVPTDRYHFLVLLDDALPGFGLEHLTSTYVSMSSERFRKAGDEKDPLSVLPHEYVHVWCGKWAAPAGLLAEDYRTPAHTPLLWVYEGLTSYYDEVLATRSGLLSPADYEEGVARLLAGYERQAGRRWRSVEDTALAMRYLRARSEAWEDLRRRQDYYGEGAVFWLTADAIIRRGTQGERSLDDFARAMFGVTEGQTIGPRGVAREYTRDDVVDGLRAVYVGEDWDALIRTMIETPNEDGESFSAPSLLGRKLVWSDTPSEKQRKSVLAGGGLDVFLTLGIRADKEGVISAVRTGSPAHQAGLLVGQRILGVRTGLKGSDYRTWSPERFRDAVKETRDSDGLALLISEGERISAIGLPYAEGLVYPKMERIEGQPDVLGAIVRGLSE